MRFDVVTGLSLDKPGPLVGMKVQSLSVVVRRLVGPYYAVRLVVARIGRKK